MNEKFYSYYFGVIKLGFLTLAAVYLIILQDEFFGGDRFLEVPLLFVLASLLIAYELTTKYRWVLLIAAIGIIGFLISVYGSTYYFLLPIVMLDTMVFFKLNPIYYFSSVLGAAGCQNKLLYVVTSLFITALYYQHHFIIQKYISYIKALLNREISLQSTLNKQDLRHRSDIEKSALVYENERLEEKGRLSQALHDKLGHSINGSIFQLEACKLLIDKKPDEVKAKLQDVILNLRESMDEIRVILKKEKPQIGEKKLVQLKKICADFKVKYNIEVELSCEGNTAAVSEGIWELLLDNTIEALSNALKYSKCDAIAVQIFVFNQMIRYTIKDNGRGCKNIKEGMGLTGIKERVRAAGGTVDITSELGFEINILVPLREETRFE